MPQRTTIPATPSARARARSLRQPLTPAEQALWNRLRARQLGGYKFRRQQPIGRFVVDFYCHESRLVVEIDGDTHDGNEQRDAARSAWLTAQGLRVVRYTNAEVHEQLEQVLAAIFEACEEWTGGHSQHPAPETRE